MGSHLFGMPNPLPAGWSGWVQLALAAPVVGGCGVPVCLRGYRSLVTRQLNMFTLIALGAGAAFLFSLVALVSPAALPPALGQHGRPPLYFEPAAVIVVLVLMVMVVMIVIVRVPVSVHHERRVQIRRLELARPARDAIQAAPAQRVIGGVKRRALTIGLRRMLESDNVRQRRTELGRQSLAFENKTQHSLAMDMRVVLAKPVRVLCAGGGKHRGDTTG